MTPIQLRRGNHCGGFASRFKFSLPSILSVASIFLPSPTYFRRNSNSKSLTQCCIAPPPPPPQPSTSAIYSLSRRLCVLYPNCCASFSALPSICMHPHSPPSLCTSMTLSTNVLLPALIFLYLLLSTVCTWLSIYIYNAVYVFLPIMLAISVFLLLAGWKGVRGGLSQLIYHIKYQPSSTFSLPLFLFPLLSRLSFLSLPFLHLLPFTSLLLTCLLRFFSACLPPLQYLSHSLKLLPLSPPALLFWRFPSLLLFFFFVNNCHMPLRLTSRLPHHDPRSLSLTFPFPFINTDMHSPPIRSYLRR